MPVFKFFKKISFAAILFLVFSLIMAAWQFLRMKEKEALIALASKNIAIMSSLEGLTSDLPPFSKVRGEVAVESFSYSMRKKSDFGVTNRYFSTFKLKDKLVVLDLGCSFKEPSQQPIRGTWIVRELPRRNQLIVTALAKLSKKSDKELPFLDFSLVSSRLDNSMPNNIVANFYLERIPEDLTLEQLFALDLSRSELLSFAKKVNNPALSTELVPCFNIISPPSLHKGYIFEWVFIGFVGGILIQLIVSRYN